LRKLFFAMLIALSSPAFGEWRLIETNKNGDSIYYDPVTLARDGALVRVSMMSDLHDVNIVGRLSYRTQHEFDCQAPRHRITRTESYSTHLAIGKALDSDSDPKDWSEYHPGSLYERERNIFCGK